MGNGVLIDTCAYKLYRKRTFFGISYWKYIVGTFARPGIDNDISNDERNPIVRLYNWEKEIIQNGIF